MGERGWRVGLARVVVPPYTRVVGGKVQKVQGYSYLRGGSGELPDLDSPDWGEVIAEIRDQGPGNCFEAAATIMTAHALGTVELSDPRYVEGSVLGTGGDVLGVRFPHAWVETDGTDGRWVLDLASGVTGLLPVDSYYRAGRVQDRHSYTMKEMAENLVRTGKYGLFSQDLIDMQEEVMRG